MAAHMIDPVKLEARHAADLALRRRSAVRWWLRTFARFFALAFPGLLLLAMTRREAASVLDPTAWFFWLRALLAGIIAAVFTLARDETLERIERAGIGPEARLVERDWVRSTDPGWFGRLFRRQVRTSALFAVPVGLAMAFIAPLADTLTVRILFVPLLFGMTLVTLLAVGMLRRRVILRRYAALSRSGGP